MNTPWDSIKCPICGKMFVPAPQHYWKIQTGYYEYKKVCTYSCMRVWERKEEANGNRKPKRRRATKEIKAQLQGV